MTITCHRSTPDGTKVTRPSPEDPGHQNCDVILELSPASSGAYEGEVLGTRLPGEVQSAKLKLGTGDRGLWRLMSSPSRAHHREFRNGGPCKVQSQTKFDYNLLIQQHATTSKDDNGLKNMKRKKNRECEGRTMIERQDMYAWLYDELSDTTESRMEMAVCRSVRYRLGYMQEWRRGDGIQIRGVLGGGGDDVCASPVRGARWRTDTTVGNSLPPGSSTEHAQTGLLVFVSLYFPTLNKSR